MVHTLTTAQFHEMRSALNSITMAVEVLAPEVSESGMVYLKMIRRNAERIVAMLSDQVLETLDPIHSPV